MFFLFDFIFPVLCQLCKEDFQTELKNLLEKGRDDTCTLLRGREGIGKTRGKNK